MSVFFRRRIEATIDHMIDMLDAMDGDPDLEPEPVEEQHDREDDPAERGIADKAAMGFVLAEMSRQRGIGNEWLGSASTKGARPDPFEPPRRRIPPQNNSRHREAAWAFLAFLRLPATIGRYVRHGHDTRGEGPAATVESCRTTSHLEQFAF